ncbi:hypothetical protein P5763_07460 [Bacillus cereus]|uniref:hypothetical protein n=1 Tax=Bacillus cereus TaxID=1396 RepID=UPI002404B873|nr:hypothetical protein [Bacillus cereus]MDF9611909.1 hypothetical protein [Bacillus cereus]
MALIYGYCYDDRGRFTEQIPLEEKPIYEKQTFYREETKEVIDEEGNISIENIKVPYEEDIIIGYEPDIPPSCTLVPATYADATWNGTKWIYDRDLIPPEPPKPPEPTPLEILTEKVELLSNRVTLNDEVIDTLKAALQSIELLIPRMTNNEKDIDNLKSDFAVMTTKLNEVLHQLELGISSRRDVQKEPMNPEDLPTFEPPQNETPEPKQDLLALYLDPSVGKE